MIDQQHRSNRLINEGSPYLQQHAHNPVDWYPWGDEAFEKARREEKPIFLSIGYSTCHWCHVMERESFEDTETATMMNELFVSIKVDREERPDVDRIYMTAAQALTGQGGWPLSVWLTPDLKPYFVGTYFPPQSRYGRPSFREALQQLHAAWINERDRVEGSAEAILNAVRDGSQLSDGGKRIRAGDEGIGSETEDLMNIAHRCFDQLRNIWDETHGGFGSRPKFPRPVLPDFLLRYYHQTGDRHALQMTLHTLKKMAAGGMYDQLGGGFCRYSVDEEWKVPHFEKMLYDQGQLLALYADAVRITGDEDFTKTIRETVAYVERDLRHEGGAFYSAEDADSEGEEGLFYVWSKKELAEIIEDETTLDVFCRYFGVTEAGNFEPGRNVLHTSTKLSEIAEAFSTDVNDIEERLNNAKQSLFAVRTQRIRPHRDEKILTSWNGLAIGGLARAAMALGEPQFAELARNAADFILNEMFIDEKLYRRWKAGDIKVEGQLDDYSYLTAGLIDLYEATFQPEYLEWADRLTHIAIELFADNDGGGFFQTDGNDPSLLVRSKEDYDGAEPSGNSVMAMNLLRLGHLFDDTDYEERAERTVRLFAQRMASHPEVTPLMVSAAMLLEQPPRQVVLVASPHDTNGYHTLIRQAYTTYQPDTVLAAVAAEGATDWMKERMPLISAMAPLPGQSVAYVCRNFICEVPRTSLVEEDQSFHTEQ